MFTCAKISEGSTYLGHHLVSNDYYCEGESVSGRWVGKGAERLGLEDRLIRSGDVTFESFRKNRLPDGSKLTPRDHADRVCFFDFQCSAQKSVSVMAMTLGDYRLMEAHSMAVTMAYAELETFAACQANTREERRNHLTGELVAARFEHSASRALDAQLHTHLVTVNATYDATSGKWRALTEEEMFRSIRYAGKCYQNELAKACLRLGYEIRDTHDKQGRITGFEIDGVSDEVLQRFSKRREQIEKAIEQFKAEKGREPTKVEIHVLTTATRDRKLKEISTPEVIRAQRAQLSAVEFARLDSLKAQAIEREKSQDTIPQLGVERHVLRHAISHTFERDCVARGHELLAESLNQRLGQIDLPCLKKAMAAEGMNRLSTNDQRGLRDLYTTRTELHREKWIQAVAREGIGEFAPYADGSFIAKKLSVEQAEAVQSILGCRDRIAVFRGAAGVGKTTALTELDRILTTSDHKVAYFAPTASATRKLREEGFENAATVASLLTASDESPVRHGAVVICDESGMLANKDGQELMRLALSHDWRLIFVGDVRQHTAVDAGDFMRLLEKTEGLHRAELTTIRRQSSEEYRKAIKLMADGHARAGIATLSELGRVNHGGADYLANAAKEYVETTRDAKTAEAVLCVAPTWEEIDALNESIRTRLKAEGRVKDPVILTAHESLGWTLTEKSEARRYQPGHAVVFNRKCGPFKAGETVSVESVQGNQVRVVSRDGHNRALPLNKGAHDVCAAKPIEVGEGDMIMLRANDRTKQLINGTLLRVESIEDGVITATGGVRFDTNEYSRFTHGYATTSHKAQGMTCDQVIVAAARLDAKAAYVACSRGKTLCSIHTPDYEKLVASLPDGTRPLALEHLDEGSSADTPTSSDTSLAKRCLSNPAWQAVFAPMPAPPLFQNPTTPTHAHEYPSSL